MEVFTTVNNKDDDIDSDSIVTEFFNQSSLVKRQNIGSMNETFYIAAIEDNNNESEVDVEDLEHTGEMVEDKAVNLK